MLITFQCCAVSSELAFRHLNLEVSQSTDKVLFQAANLSCFDVIGIVTLKGLNDGSMADCFGVLGILILKSLNNRSMDD